MLYSSILFILVTLGISVEIYFLFIEYVLTKKKNYLTTKSIPCVRMANQLLYRSHAQVITEFYNNTLFMQKKKITYFARLFDIRFLLFQDFEYKWRISFYV